MPNLYRVLALSILLVLTVSVAAQPAAEPASQTAEQTLRLGTAWYPEQWPEARWEADLALMQAAHMNVVRVGEFAWSTMEPSEGKFEFGWLDRAIALAARHHLQVVLGTPTAAPPAWLTTRYPETLRLEEDGRRAEHGNRQQFSATSPRYRVLAARIAHEMAARYGHNANVIGWQIDNEIGAPTFDPSAVALWHRWLANRYGTVAELNRRWTTAYWSETYDTFDQVPFHSRNENPGLLLDYKRFVTDTWTAYIGNQVDAIRPLVDPRQFITTNTMHWFSVYDHYVLHRNLDLAAWDDYFPDGHLDPILNAASHDLVRGYKPGHHFWVMETQPAFVNWGPVNAPLPPGVTREMAWQAIGHGADAVLYWQWRSALNGQEEYHGTLIGADGLPVPVYAEIAQLGKEMDAAGKALAGTSPRAAVAILNDYDSRWAIDFQKHTQKYDYVGQIADLYRAIQPVAGTIDIVAAAADLIGYKAVFAPSLNVLPEPVAKHLLAYVQAGGHLILGPRSGMKDLDNALDPRRQPGPLAAALGAHVAQYYALDKAVPVEGNAADAAMKGNATVWAEALTTTDPATRVLLTYGAGSQPGWLDHLPAAVTRAVGSGTITYVGATLDPALLRVFAGRLLREAGVQPVVADLPEGIEVNVRVRASGRGAVWIVINHGETTQHLTLPTPARDLLAGGQPVVRELALNAHAVAMLELQ